MKIMEKKISNIVRTMSGNISKERQDNDFYSTPYCATQALVDRFDFDRTVPILEPMCGKGHIANVLIKNGYDVKMEDLISYPNIETGEMCEGGHDFMKRDFWNGNIITNPPYGLSSEMVRHALDIIPCGLWVAMLLRLQFLEGQERYKLYQDYPLKYVYVFSKRIGCSKNGETTENIPSAQCFCWFVWQKGYVGESTVRWIWDLKEGKQSVPLF